MKLTPKQKEIIKAMRESEAVFYYVGQSMQRYRFNGKTVRYDTGADLQAKKLIFRTPKDPGLFTRHNVYYTLTDLGRTIDL